MAKISFLTFLGLLLGIGFLNPARSDASSQGLSVQWLGGGASQLLKGWTLPELFKLKRAASKEKDPATGKLVRYEGVLLSLVVEKALEGVTPDQRAQVDLLVLTDRLGHRALIPRSLVTKYPVLVAQRGESLFGVMPWTSKPKILKEEVPVSAYFVSELTALELTSYREKYGQWFLKKRSDPGAVRGEKLFVQNCMSCHAVGHGPAPEQVVLRNSGKSDFQHPALVSMSGLGILGDRERRALLSYFDARRLEMQTAVSVVPSVEAKAN
ncbi:cytochrome c [Bdellovibrionota bacterium FG-2]